MASTGVGAPVFRGVEPMMIANKRSSSESSAASSLSGEVLGNGVSHSCEGAGVSGPQAGGYGSIFAHGHAARTDEEQALLLPSTVPDSCITNRTVATRFAAATTCATDTASAPGGSSGAFNGASWDASSSSSLSYTKNGHEAEKSWLRKWAIHLSLYVNILILVAKLVAYVRTLSLSVLAALVDSVLDVISQLVLSFTEHKSQKGHGRSSAQYPAGAARLEPIGVLTCAALMGMASFEVIKEALEALIYDQNVIEGEHLSSVWSMVAIVLVKVVLLIICKKAGEEGRKNRGLGSSKAVVVVSDPTLEALAQDHLNDALSNAVAAVALLTALWHPSLWFFDPLGAICISVYIIYSWYSTGKEQIEQLTGKAAPDDFIEELHEIASNHDSKLVVDVCRAYHFGPKFLVELEVVLPKTTLLQESHDIGMDLQYEIEAREEVERCFVHIDYEKRGYDEHVVSKNPELMEKYRPASFRKSLSGPV